VNLAGIDYAYFRQSVDGFVELRQGQWGLGTIATCLDDDQADFSPAVSISGAAVALGAACL
jgi:hypothetical protein